MFLCICKPAVPNRTIKKQCNPNNLAPSHSSPNPSTNYSKYPKSLKDDCFTRSEWDGYRPVRREESRMGHEQIGSFSLPPTHPYWFSIGGGLSSPFFLFGSCWRGGKEIFCPFCIFSFFSYKLLAFATPTGILVYLVEIMVFKICIQLPHSYTSPSYPPTRNLMTQVIFWCCTPKASLKDASRDFWEILLKNCACWGEGWRQTAGNEGDRGNVCMLGNCSVFFS